MATFTCAGGILGSVKEADPDPAELAALQSRVPSVHSLRLISQMQEHLQLAAPPSQKFLFLILIIFWDLTILRLA